MDVKRSKLLLQIFILLVLSACATRGTKTKTGDPTKPPIILGNEESRGSTDDDETPAAEAPVIPNAGTSTPTTQTSPTPTKALPKFGFIFSGGGAKTWAHIGVLKELQKLKWPVNSVAGFEWGSVVAAAYAQNLSANEVEWEMSKLKEFEKWESFIGAAFGKKTVAELRVPFVCPSMNISKQNAYLLNRGLLSYLLPFCVPSPTLIGPINQSVAVMSDVSSLAQHLRATGSSKIVLINVLSQSTKRSFTKDYESSDNIIWVESAALMAKKPAGVDEVININLDDYGIADLNKRREIIAKGSELSYNQLKKLADKYGL